MKANHSSYRPDIDGLRAFAVLAVLFFHAGVGVFSGGFVGVDVFFVISGYLITTIIFIEIREGRFSFLSFYQRRITRIIPAALITLLLVLIFGFFLSPPDELKKLGYDIIFSSIGAMNILLAQGVDYFTHDGNVKPLVHFWSLGVEEQFYVVWPVLLLLTFRFGLKSILTISTMLLLASLLASVWAVNSSSKGSYYMLQYRAFELLIGCILALFIHSGYLPTVRDISQKTISAAAALLLIVPVFVLDAESEFPGFNALWPCTGAALLLAFPGHGLSFRILSFRPLVALGLISYPLYLYHQPVLAFYNNNFSVSHPLITLALVLIICLPMAWLTWAFVERPLRQFVKSSSKGKLPVLCLIIFCMTFVAACGYYVYRNNGYPLRFQSINPFASDLIAARKRAYRTEFRGGFQIDSSSKNRVLFLGDSTMQHYALPFAKSLGLTSEEIDTFTRGGCILLKGIDFENFFKSSCNDLRPKIYSLNKHWDTVVISQHWRTDVDKQRNSKKGTDVLDRWTPYIDATIEHFSALGADVILIGDHAYSSGTERLRANVLINKATYEKTRDSVFVTNLEDMNASRIYFDNFAQSDNVRIIHPVDIICSNKCITHDGEWLFFRDRLHFTIAATNFIAQKLDSLLGHEPSHRTD